MRLGIRMMIVVAAAAVPVVGLSACAPPPDGPAPIAVGDCFKYESFAISASYQGPTGALGNMLAYDSLDCTGASIEQATVVFAEDEATAVAKCAAISSELTLVEHLSTVGWTVTTSGEPISDQVWGCGVSE